MTGVVSVAPNDDIFSKILKDFFDSIEDIQTVALISLDGLPIDSVSELEIDQESISAIIASYHSFSETTLGEFDNSKSKEVIITSESGVLLLENIPQNDLVLFIYGKDPQRTGYYLYHARQFRDQLITLFE